MRNVVLVAIISCCAFSSYIHQTAGYYTLTTHGLQRKNEIEVLLSIIVKSINQYEASLLLEGTEDNPIIESLQDGLTSLIDFMKSYQDFLQAILNSGDPTKASPRDIVHAIGLFLDRLMNTVSDIDGIKLKLQQVRPALAEKVGQILQNFPNDAREIFKALTQICLINEEGGSMTSTEKAGEAEKNMIEALLSLKTNVEALGFLFRSDGLSAGKQTLEVLKQSVESLQFAIQINRYTLSDVQSDYAFRYELTKSSIESGWQVTRDFIVNKFPAIEGHFVLEKIENQKSVYDAAATMIIDGFNKLLDDFQLAYDKKLSEAVTSTQLAVTSTKQTILKLMKRNFERIAEVVACLQRDGFDERIRNVSDGFAAASKAVEGLVLNVTSLNVLANDYDSYVVKLARTVIKAEDNEQVDEDVEQWFIKNEASLNATLEKTELLQLETSAFSAVDAAFVRRLITATESLQGLGMFEKLISSSTYCLSQESIKRFKL